MPNRRMYQVFLRAFINDADQALIAEVALFECHSWREALKKKEYYQSESSGDMRYKIIEHAIKVTWGDCVFNVDIRS